MFTVSSMHIIKFRSHLLIALEQMTTQLKRAQASVVQLRSAVSEKHDRLKQILRERENGLQNLMACPLEAILITNVERRFVAATPQALTLFGISAKNLRQFTLDAFLPQDQILDFEKNSAHFLRGGEKRGECKVRRLDGSLRPIEYAFIANFVPRRHVFKFIAIDQDPGINQHKD